MSLALLAFGSKSVVIREFTANVSAFEPPKVASSLTVKFVAVSVLTPVTFPESSIMTRLFWISLPVVKSKRVMALSVADAGPTTSPPKDGLEFVTVKLGYVPLTVIPVPLAIATVWSGAVLVTVKLGYVPLVLIPVPLAIATTWSGAVLVIFKVPLVVIGLPVILMPVPAVAATLVTVPLPPETVAQDVVVPLVVRYLPVLPVCDGARASNAALAVV